MQSGLRHAAIKSIAITMFQMRKLQLYRQSLEEVAISLKFIVIAMRIVIKFNVNINAITNDVTATKKRGVIDAINSKV